MDSVRKERSVGPGSDPSYLMERVVQTFLSPGRPMRDVSHELKTVGVLLLGRAWVGLTASIYGLVFLAS